MMSTLNCIISLVKIEFLISNSEKKNTINKIKVTETSGIEYRR